jgi:chromosome segregation ATPase
MHVANITLDPEYGAASSQYTFKVLFGADTNSQQITLADQVSSPAEVTFDINAYITGVALNLYGGPQFNFDEITIVYFPEPDPFADINARLDALEASVADLQLMLDNLNSTVNDINVTQQYILENITNLWTMYNTLNTTVSDFIAGHEDYNDTWISENLTSIGADIAALQDALADMNFNDTDFNEMIDSLNQTSQDIAALQDDITMLNDTMPDEYNDTTLLAQIAVLEAKNGELEDDNSAMAARIATLEGESGAQKKEVDDLKDELEAQKSMSILEMAVAIMALIAIVIALAAFASKGKEEKEARSKFEDEPPSEEEE